MMGRLWFWLLMAALTYFAVKSSFRSGSRAERKIPRKPKPRMEGPEWSEQDPEDMNKDPVCGTYVGAGSDNFVEHEGRRVYFCSPECRQAFLSSLVVKEPE